MDVPDADYRSDVYRALSAFATDSTAQRQKMVSALRDVYFIRAVDARTGSHHFARPPDAYQATQRMKDLFAGVPGVLIIDDSKDYLRGDRIRTLLEAAGSPLYLLPASVESPLTPEEKADLRQRETGDMASSYDIELSDHTLVGLKSLLTTIPGLTETEGNARVKLLWEALCDVADRRGSGVFEGEYRWMRYGARSAVFNPYFVRLLNETRWIPDGNGVLQRPGDVVFESTGWKENPFLLTKIVFKPPVIDELAREAGIDPGVLTLLTQYGLTSVEQLTSQLRRAGLMDGDGEAGEAPSTADPNRDISDGAAGQISPVSDSPDPTGASDSGSKAPTDAEPGTPANQPSGGVNDPAGADGTNHAGSGDGSEQHQTGQDTQSGDGRQFVSYVALNSEDEEDSDPDGLTQQERMNLEDNAIGLILEHEPRLKRTPMNNPGFDLLEPGTDGQPVKWVEVKAMRATLGDRPVGITRTQFEFGRKHGKAFWLYIVESARDPKQARIVRIQDPVGKSQTFTFDHGWIEVAEIAKTTE